MKAFRIKYRAKSGISVTPVTGEVMLGGYLVTRHPDGYDQIFKPKEWDATLQGAMEKAKTLRSKKREALVHRMDKLTTITVVGSEKCQS